MGTSERNPVPATWAALRAAERVAGQSMDNVRLAVRAAVEVQVATAQREAGELRGRLTQQLSPQLLVGVFATPESDDRAVAAAAAFLQTNGGVTLDAAELWAELAAAVDPVVTAERWLGVSAYSRLNLEVQELAGALGYTAPLPSLEYREAQVASLADLQVEIRQRVTQAYPDLHRRRLLKRAVDQVVAMESCPPGKVPVLVVGAAAEERANLAGLFARGADATLPPEFEADAKSVPELFKKRT